ncbi:SgcJ/EcaC family oxidoreductase [Microscilla marina]|nr:SgcJ/EcaC family oxidoreductase [Microscilla marina]
MNTNTMFQQTYTSNPEDIVVLFVQAFNDRDAVALANLFVEDAEFVNVVGLWWHNRQAIWKAHDYGLKTIFNQSIVELRKVKIKLVTPEVALVQARMKLTGQTAHADITQPQSRQNVISFVAYRQSLGWVAVSAHNTDIIPGKETNIVDESGNITSVDYREQ